MKKTIITGEKGKTVCYQLANFRYEEGYICWDVFKFYTPLGTQTDTDGHKYFEVPAISELIERDDVLNKEILFKVTQSESTVVVEIIEIFESAASPAISVGIEGDIVCVVFVPTDPGQNIEIEYKEVTNG